MFDASGNSDATGNSGAVSGASDVAGNRAWQTALTHIEGELIAGRLRPGDHLAPERRLAADLGVGRSSIREALRVLEVLGLVRTGTGSGPTAGAIIVATPQGGMSTLMRLQVAALGFPVADVVDTRLILEDAVVRRLSTSSTPPDLDQADALLDAMDAPTLTAAEFLALDARFHVALAEASGNAVVSATMTGLRDSIEGYVRGGAENLPSWAATAARLRDEHRGIVRAIHDGDEADAARLVRAHITGYYAEAGFGSAPAQNPHPSTPKETHHG